METAPGLSTVSGRGSTWPHCYRIVVFGRLGEAGHAAFDDLRIEPCGTDTALIGELDSPGLRGVLDRIMGIGLELVELSRLS